MRDDLDPGNDQPRDRAAGHPHRRLARRSPPAAARIAEAVFGIIGIIGMARAVGRIGRVIGTALVDIVDHEPDRGAGGAAPKHPRQDAHPVGFLPRRDIFRRPRTAPVEQALDMRLVEVEPRRAAVDDAADRRSVTLAPGGQAE